MTLNSECKADYLNRDVQDTIIEEWLGGHIPDKEMEVRLQ